MIITQASVMDELLQPKHNFFVELVGIGSSTSGHALVLWD